MSDGVIVVPPRREVAPMAMYSGYETVDMILAISVMGLAVICNLILMVSVLLSRQKKKIMWTFFAYSFLPFSLFPLSSCFALRFFLSTLSRLSFSRLRSSLLYFSPSLRSLSLSPLLRHHQDRVRLRFRSISEGERPAKGMQCILARIHNFPFSLGLPPHVLYRPKRTDKLSAITWPDKHSRIRKHIHMSCTMM